LFILFALNLQEHSYIFTNSQVKEPSKSLVAVLSRVIIIQCSLHALGKLGNIVAEKFVILDVSSNVSMFAHPWKHCCGNKIYFPGSKNVS
jgi:hypothetical protein